MPSALTVEKRAAPRAASPSGSWSALLGLGVFAALLLGVVAMANGNGDETGK